MSNYDLNKHKKSDKIKWIITGVAFVLVFVFLAGLCMQLFGKGKIKPSEWFKKTEQTTPAAPDGSEENGGAIVTDNETDGDGVQIKSRKLMRTEYEENGISAQADTAFTLTATVLPEEAFDKSVDWSIAWQNANSEWANGKNISDYYSITPTSDGACTANAVCKQAFAEPVIITCKLRTADISATVKADYVSKLTLTFDMSSYCLCDGMDASAVYHENWSIGTITGGTVVFGDNCVDMVFQGEVASAISDMPYGDYLDDYFTDIYFNGSIFSPTSDDENLNMHWKQIFAMGNEYVNGDYTWQEKLQFELKAQNHIFKYFKDRFGQTEIANGVKYCINYTYTIDGQTHNGYNEVYAAFSTRFVQVSATSVSVNEVQLKH